MAQRQSPQVRASTTPKAVKTAVTSGPLRTNIGPAGRIVIPAAMRAALGMEEGAEVMMRIVGEELRIMTPAAAMRLAQAMVMARIPAGRSLADELIEERAREEMEEFGNG